MVTLTQIISQYLKDKGQPIATPAPGEIEARRKAGFHNGWHVLSGEGLSSWASGHLLVSQTLNNWSSGTPASLRPERRPAWKQT
jgi:hypothetical protein